MNKHGKHLVLGLTGASGSGKTTIAEKVRERLLLPRRAAPVYLAKFAGPIVAALELWGIGREHPDFRQIAQYVGQGLREINEDFWVSFQREYVAGLSHSGAVVIYDDVRYPNEAELCDLVVQLRTYRDNGLTADQMRHESEQAWWFIPSDMTFPENETQADAERIADQIAARVKEMME